MWRRTRGNCDFVLVEEPALIRSSHIGRPTTSTITPVTLILCKEACMFVAMVSIEFAR